MYQTFSGYFKIHDCARALKASKDDIEEAANYLVSEKEKPNQIIFKRTSSQILCESQLMSANEPEKSDWQLMPGSLITQRAACPGRWTLAQRQLTFHHNTMERPDMQQALVFNIGTSSLTDLEP